MPFSITKLPLELLSEITRNVTSKEDLCRLRRVNSIFKTLATPAAFSNIVVRSNKKSADSFFTLIYTPHMVRHVQSIEYVESTLRQQTDTYFRIVDGTD